MKRVLVLYATREGQTRKIATRVAMHLQNFGADVQLIDAADATAADAIELVDFDLLVFGASMHAGGLEREMVDYVNRNRAQIEMRPRSFFLVLLSAAAENPQLRESWLGDARQKLKQQLSVGFADTQMIAGALLYSKYSLPVRWFMKRIASKAGGATDTSKDYEYTNWQQVARYAQRLSKALALSTG